MLASQLRPGNGEAYFRHTGDSAYEDELSAMHSHNILRRPRVVGTRVGREANEPAANWYMNGRGLSEDILAAAAQSTLALVRSFVFQGATCLDRGLDVDGVGKEGTGSRALQRREWQIESYQRGGRTQILPGPLAASDRRKPTTKQAL